MPIYQATWNEPHGYTFWAKNKKEAIAMMSDGRILCRDIPSEPVTFEHIPDDDCLKWQDFKLKTIKQKVELA